MADLVDLLLVHEHVKCIVQFNTETSVMNDIGLAVLLLRSTVVSRSFAGAS